MRLRTVLLAAAGIFAGRSCAFSIHDDVFAFPQYEIVFSNSYISQGEAESRLARAATEVHSQTHIPGPEASDEPSSDLSTRDQGTRHTGSGEEGGESLAETYERMILRDKPYLCSIPSPQAPKNKTEEEAAPQDDEKELARATERGWQLLQELNGNCLYYQSGWWSYSFCYQGEIKQFHPQAPPRGHQPAYPPVEDKKVPSFHLGEFQGDGKPPKQLDGSADPKPGEPGSTALALQTKGDVRYLSQNLTGGSTCDLTGKPRRVEIQFHCHPQSTDRIGWIKETATCTYLMVIYTPRLCNDVAFLPPKEHEAEQIVCREVVAEADVDAWKAQKAAEAERLLLASATGAPSRPVVGGIAVGGYKQVPHEGQRISPPQLVEQVPNKGDVIAQWHPGRNGGEVRQMSDAELRRHDLDPNTVEDMKEQIHHEADGRPWKLEIVEIGGGIRELIGIVERPEEDVLDEGEGAPAEQEDSEDNLKDEL